ncbi:MAG: O-antigen ligase family protein [Sphingomonadales bacterium]
MNVPVWERLFVVLVMVTACRGFDSIQFILGGGGGKGTGELGDSSPGRFAWLATLYGISLMLLLAHHHRDIFKLMSQNKLLLVIVGYILVSPAWAYDPDASLRRAIAFSLTASFCAYLALRYPPTEILKLAGWGLLVVAVVSVMAVVLFPEFGRELFGRKMGWWKGICGINTAFGRFMALGILVIWCLRRVDWKLQRFDMLVFGLFLVCTFQAHAATAIAAVFGAYCSILAIWSRSMFNIELAPKVLIGILAGLVLLATVPFYLGDVLLLLGRDETLTNRVFIWGAAFEQGWNNPIFGVGYESFWIEGNAAAAFYNMFGSGNTRIGNGHNGYLDVWLELGFVGLGLMLLLLIQAFTRVVRYLTVSGEPFAEFYGGLLVFIVIYSVAEKVIFVHSEFTWMMFMTGLMALRWRLATASQPESVRTDWDGALPQISQRIQ